ncbi:nicotinate-nucleotide adenylyltransferase [Clostridium luticellarii]|jgi:nicotinate-nucleotide adenylyltransferase|uniref:Probable nicotinate-nucleotide adenylyltransferase n=1 Tax=Clostridium luticellarii TaxID=1691940 RepID=A0A2T0BPH2_9CLOT|nr:nicotinate-nucleotide adenylyltransferase [Clostridium luticellarii]MCI1945790.1 nicotinate-nucleotide adenylyltransferase [Clostridium luticellarii]MCI1967614.1 nicotinate-nucleotide adenylyltransferase [Clostridium luticellarii]MCI1996481.1 nicotinate-nucleotide adenylyltransferase [Clostridium luticellarii]MCI2041166.1 nicotinate-nucleotide adenylyltransferase [Clostridium luticellarii]PRR85770.1 Nicotinate-nucleotide adenylyltransferase [Clostridium luticellarii]
MIKKAIFGGTFDPIHIGHIHIAYEALYMLKLDKVVFVPTGNPPHKSKEDITDALLRHKMVKEAIKSEDKFTVSDYEISRPNLSYTYNTLKYFSDLEKQTQWYFLVGMDCLMDLENWNKIEDIFKLCQFIVFNRPSFPAFTMKSIKEKKKKIEDRYSTEIIYLNAPLLDISSTTIRKNISEGRNVNYLLPGNVSRIIKQLGLYK